MRCVASRGRSRVSEQGPVLRSGRQLIASLGNGCPRKQQANKGAAHAQRRPLLHMRRTAEIRTTWYRPWCESAATAVGLSWVAMPACHAALQEHARTHRFGTCLTTERGVHIEHPCSKWAAAFGSSGGSQAVTWSHRSTRAQSSPGRCELIATTGPRQGGRGARQCRVAALTVEHIVVVHRRPLRLLKILCFPPVARLAEQNGKQQSSTSHLAARALAPLNQAAPLGAMKFAKLLEETKRFTDASWREHWINYKVRGGLMLPVTRGEHDQRDCLLSSL